METSMIIAYLQAPLLLALLLVYLKAKFEIKKWNNIIKAILLGFFTILVLLVFDLIAESLGYDQLKNLKRMGFFSFAIVGFGSEFGKFVLLRYVFLKQKTFKGPLEGVIYGFLIGLAFTIIAVPLFAMGVFGRPVDNLFLFTYPLANICFATIMGFFVGMGKFRKNKLIDSFTGLATASFFHGFFYFANLTSDKSILMFFGAGVILISLLLGVKAVNVKEEQRTK